MLADCLASGRVENYAAELRRELMDDLAFGAEITERFYKGRFLLDSVTTRMVQFSRRSPTFEDLMQDLIAGSQTYLGLKARLWRQLGVTLWEIAASCLRGAPLDSNEPLQVSRPV